MTIKVKSFKDFCPVAWYPDIYGDRGSRICAFSNKEDPQPARSLTDFDIMYQCYSDSCPATLQGWSLIMADEIDSDSCATETIYLQNAFDNGSCLKSRIPPPPTAPHTSPAGQEVPSAPADSGKQPGCPVTHLKIVVVVIASSVFFLLLCMWLFLHR